MIKNIRNSLTLFIIFILAYSCKNETQYYYYAFYTQTDSLPDSYIIKRIVLEKDRNEVDFMFTPTGELKSKTGNVFKVTNIGLDKKTQGNGYEGYKPYLRINSKEKVDFKYSDESLNDFASTSFQFKTNENIKLEGKEYKNIYKFIKKQGSINEVTSEVYLDRDLILIKEEFVKGERPYYKVEKIDTVLNFSIE